MYITYVGICSPEFQFIFRSLYVFHLSRLHVLSVCLYVCVYSYFACSLSFQICIYVYSIPNSTLDCRLLTQTYTCVESSLNSIVLDL